MKVLAVNENSKVIKFLSSRSHITYRETIMFRNLSLSIVFFILGCSSKHFSEGVALGEVAVAIGCKNILPLLSIKDRNSNEFHRRAAALTQTDWDNCARATFAKKQFIANGNANQSLADNNSRAVRLGRMGVQATGIVALLDAIQQGNTSTTFNFTATGDELTTLGTSTGETMFTPSSTKEGPNETSDIEGLPKVPETTTMGDGTILTECPDQVFRLVCR